MRIGELLVEHRKLRRGDLDRVVAEQKSDRRLASLLISRGLVEFDDASRALGEQRGVPCALAKHLAGRDPALAKLIPAELGRAACALPIGRTSGGALIVCVRDPAPALLATLQAAAKAEVLMVIAPAQRLEHLVQTAYGDASVDEFDVDFDSSVDVQPPPKASAPKAPAPPPEPDMTALDPDSVRLALTDLDDARVDKDFSQSGQFSTTTPPNASRTPTRPITEPPLMSRTSTKPMNDPPPRMRTEPGRITLPPAPPSLETIQAALEQESSRAGATDRALAYIAGRWVTGLVLALQEGRAIGYRGHNVKLPENVAIDLAHPSVISRAIEAKRPVPGLAVEPAAKALAYHHGATIAQPAHIAAAPVIVRGQPVAVLAVGDPIAGDGDVEDAIAALGKLAHLLGKAYESVTGAATR
jgi:hypothetical protein